ncbi:class I SAM-dependent methyltransferase [Terasakiella sp. SH-1]|uniref:class I SAM-dependent methyltransferase n=1 Tax=Terasakiella sp. SH-1 TaxID=2560057 RepID=UPI001073F9C2|nr:class I SAM-dependent methyltransferase [Terasakiella sp. SH-1]
MDRKQNSEVLKENIVFAGKKILDIGSGNGGLTRFMARLGATVTGLEPSPLQLEKAHAAEAVPGASYICGGAENLDFEKGNFDSVIFFNSLHHIPEDIRFTSLKNVSEIINETGLIYISEPLAQGSYFETMKLIEDETEVRADAYRQIKRCAEIGLREDQEILYIHTVFYKSYESFRSAIIAPNEDRKRIFESKDKEIRALFDEHAQKTFKGYEFSQPMRVNILKKV